MKIVRLKEVDAVAWDKRAKELPETNIFQLSSFLKRPLVTLDNYRPIYLVVKEEGSILAQMLIFEGSELNRLLADSALFPIIRPLFNILFKSYRCAYGPLIFDQVRYYEILHFLIKYLDESLFPKGLQIRNLIPAIHKAELDQEKVKSIFDSQGFKTTEWGTFVTRVDTSLEELWNKLGKESRKKIRKAEQQEISISEVTNYDMLRQYYEISNQVAWRNSLTKKSWKAFVHSFSDPFTKIFLSYKHGLPVSGQMAMISGKIVLLGGVATSNYAVHEKIFGNDLMQWFILKWAHNSGYSQVDSVGVCPSPEKQTPKEKGIYSFKKRWGGNLLRYYSFSKIYAPRNVKNIEKIKMFAKGVILLQSRLRNKIGEKKIHLWPADCILSATSKDGLYFERDSKVCIEGNSTFMPEMVYSPNVSRLANGHLRMYFYKSKKTIKGWRGDILTALSRDGENWTLEPIKSLRDLMSVDCKHVQSPRLVSFKDKKMLYFCAKIAGNHFRPYVAHTHDGITLENPTALCLNCDDPIMDFSFCIFDDCIRMYFYRNKDICSARSLDGILWEIEDGIRIKHGAKGMKGLVANPSIIQLETGQYRLYFRATNKNALGSYIYSAISDNGLEFKIEDGLRMDYSGKLERHGVAFPHVIKFRNYWKMYYTGYWGPHLMEPLTLRSYGK